MSPTHKTKLNVDNIASRATSEQPPSLRRRRKYCILENKKEKVNNWSVLLLPGVYICNEYIKAGTKIKMRKFQTKYFFNAATYNKYELYS